MLKKKSGESAINKDTSWGGVAEWYNGLLEGDADSYQSKVVMPNVLRVLDPKPNMKVLDMACGQGYFSRAFRRSGAEVSACDISPELVDFAKSHQEKDIAYEVAPSDKTSFASKTFDAVVIILAIQNIERVPETFAECFRLLRDDGRLIVVMNHPAFRVPKLTAWGSDDKTGEMYRIIHAYNSESKIEMDMNPGEKNARKKKTTVSFHRPLQYYFKNLQKAGFAVTKLEEWISHKKSEKGPKQAEEDRIRKEIPMFLMLEAKPNRQN